MNNFTENDGMPSMNKMHKNSSMLELNTKNAPISHGGGEGPQSAAEGMTWLSFCFINCHRRVGVVQSNMEWKCPKQD